VTRLLVPGFVRASFGATDRAYAQEGPAGAGGVTGNINRVLGAEKEARYGHRVYGAVVLNVGR
jgi:hypothetical protein